MVTKRKSPKREEKKMSSAWRPKNQRKGSISGGSSGTAVLNAAEVANGIWAETGLLMTHKNTFCRVVKAKVRRL